MNNETYYLDANALLKYYKVEQGSNKIRELVDSKDKKIWISKLTLLECCAVLFRLLRTSNNSQEDKIDKPQKIKLEMQKNKRENG